MTRALPPLSDRPRRRLTPAAGLLALVLTAGCGSGAGGDDAPARSSGPSGGPGATSSVDPQQPATGRAAFAALEERYAARVGVVAIDTATGETLAHRADERFPYASTVKALAAAVLLDRTTPSQLERVVPVRRTDLVEYSPVVEQRVGRGLTLGAAAEAAVRVSDNTAGNIVLEAIGGPDGLRRALRGLGDRVTDPRRTEPTLNRFEPGDDRDTTTPRALATTLRTLAVDDTLAPSDRRLLLRWMSGNETGDTLVRAGVPDDWAVADKSGSGATYAARNDVAVVTPPGRAPVVVAVLTRSEDVDAVARDALVAAAAGVVARGLGEAG
ncbi:class A beta-lactamase [Nocardioides kribbensis]|uniref:class A beta-lactamase n=1 Tax=Nocardioides kribbensis TaxID=305517 RepID=UPI0029D419CA|nr:class A beta-lactamase [Nocardioides kribbensis]